MTDLGLITEAKTLEKKINDLMKLREKRNRYYSGPFQRTELEAESGKRAEAYLSKLDEHILSIRDDIDMLAERLAKRIDNLKGFGKYKTARDIELWQPLEELKRLLE